jgi:hypothetical protein
MRMKRFFIASLLFAALTLGLPPPSEAQQNGFNATGSASLSVSGTSSTVALPNTSPVAIITNTGSNTAYVKFGISTVTATTSSIPLLAGYTIAFQVPAGSTTLAAITSTSTTALTIITGSGPPFVAQVGTGGGSGTVTSVALADGSTVPIYTISGSPVTGSGTLNFTLSTETANKIFAGPTTGSAAQPGFRSLVSADIPATPFATGSSTGNTLTAPRGYFVCTSTCTVTPPVPAAGYEFCVMNDDNVNTVITLGAIGSSARYEATARTGYGTAGTGTLSSGGAVGDMICIVGRDSTHYLSTTYVGTWTTS